VKGKHAMSLIATSPEPVSGPYGGAALVPPPKLAHHVIVVSRSNPRVGETEVASKRCYVGYGVGSHATNFCDWRLERLLDRLPRLFRSTIRWLRQPSSVWIRLIRMSAGGLLICCGFLGFLPLLGFWMFPVGLALLADDVSLLRSVRSRILDWIERHHPRWLDE
jgi:hypothetical protein